MQEAAVLVVEDEDVLDVLVLATVDKDEVVGRLLEVLGMVEDDKIVEKVLEVLATVDEGAADEEALVVIDGFATAKTTLST